MQRLVEIAFITGWRWESELLTRRWTDVDFKARELRLEVGEGKDKDTGRVFPLGTRLYQILQDQHAYCEAIAEREHKKITHVFVRPDGHHIIDCRKAIWAAFDAAGFKGRIMHDMRRSAVRNLERAGVPRSTAKRMVGHKTDNMYERYSIVDQGMLQVGSDKLDQFLASQ
jgi:integrase